MRSRYVISPLIFASLISYHVTSSGADWGSFLDDAKTIGTDLLSNQLGQGSGSNLDSNTIISGLKEALDVGTRKAISQVGQTDGYLANDLIRIPLPPELQQVSDLMSKVGLGAQAEQFELSLNRAAEKAAPEATAILVDAIKSMSIEDASKILNGSNNAATEYFKTQTSAQLAALFKPTIDSSLNEVGSTKYYTALSQQIAAVPIVGKQVDVDLSNYVTEQALNGLFAVIALEEKKIRENPAARTTELLKQVFAK